MLIFQQRALKAATEIAMYLDSAIGGKFFRFAEQHLAMPTCTRR